MTLRTFMVLRHGLLCGIALSVLGVFWLASARLDRTADAAGTLTSRNFGAGTSHGLASAREFRSVRAPGDPIARHPTLQVVAPRMGAASASLPQAPSRHGGL